MASPPPPALYPPVPTFFKADHWTLDLDTQKKHTEFLVKNGIKGVTVNGTTGENAHLTREERCTLVRLVREVGGKDFVVISGVVQNSADEAIAEIKALKEAGANYALTVTSNYFGGAVSQEGIVNWFTRVADGSPLPIMIYLFPGVSNGVVVSDDSFEKLASHPNIVGAKFTYSDATLFVKVGLNPKIQAQKFEVFPGFASFLIPAYTVIGGGLVDGLGNVFPKAISKLHELALKKDFSKEALDLQYKVAIAEKICEDGGVPGAKALLKHFTGLGETLSGRPPLDQDYNSDLLTTKYLKGLEPLAEIENSL